MSTTINAEDLSRMLTANIQAAIEEAVQEVAAPLIEDMQNKVRQEVSKKLGTIACQFFQEYDMRMMGNILEIRVRNQL